MLTSLAFIFCSAWLWLPFSIGCICPPSSFAQGEGVRLLQFADIPLSILLGIVLGAVCGGLLSCLFEAAYAQNRPIRSSRKLFLLLGASFLLLAIESWAAAYVSVSGLLAVVSMACVLRLKSPSLVTERLSEKFGKLWLAAELILFVPVGATVDIRYTLHAGFAAVLLILLALLFRTVGVLLCLLATPLNKRERLFCVIAYLPKATVQAAICSVPLSQGLPCGEIVLSIAVLSILLTAPLGAFGIDHGAARLLSLDRPAQRAVACQSSPKLLSSKKR